jgi:hypothetical protein
VSISKGLKQGDPLAPFLFLLVAEGLGALMSRAVELNFFKPFVVKQGEAQISHLQYADDTLLIGDDSVENIWCMKAILRWFELMSGLKVNFSKSKLYGINVESGLLSVAAKFLNCLLGSMPFMYLGLPVGANPRKEETWKPVVESLKNRLFSWQNRYISFGGRVTLINSVLASLPIFYLSFMKMPVKVWKVLVSIQRNFLWGGASGKKKIAWVKWSDICRSKEKGGLGIRNLRLVNISLLAKWRWRLLSAPNEVWAQTLIAKYGKEGGLSSDLRRLENRKFASLWWKDICRLGEVNRADRVDWCRAVMIKKLGNGYKTSFWNDVWIDDVPLCVVFPRLFSMTTRPTGTINQFGRWRSGVWLWEFVWRRNPFVWEEELIGQLLTKVNRAEVKNCEDAWVSLIGNDDVYSVKAGYHYLCNNFLPDTNLSEHVCHTMKNQWCSLAPQKVVIFAWQLLHQRLPTRTNLLHRGIIAPELGSQCCLCCEGRESETHLFATCSFAMLVWSGINQWMGLQSVQPGSLQISFDSFGFPFNCRKRRQGLYMIWQATCWLIWRARNSKIFEGKDPIVSEVVDAIKRTSLQWLLAKRSRSVCLAYEWIKFPLECLAR